MVAASELAHWRQVPAIGRATPITSAKPRGLSKSLGETRYLGSRCVTWA